MINNIKLKDLVWKEIDKEKELKKLEKQWYINYHKVEEYHLINNFYFDNAEQIAKEKAEILNKPIEYTKQDIIEMFVEAGFQVINNEKLIYDYNYIVFGVLICHSNLCFFINKHDGDSDMTNESLTIDFKDIKAIEFYYNKFREILEFEVGNDTQ